MSTRMVSLLALAAATFVSEDLACVSAGLLIARGDVGAVPAIIACAVGIFLGDCGLWVLGRCGVSPIRRARWLPARIPAAVTDECRAWLERRGAVAILASRFVPGTRLPLYVTAGAVGMSLRLFAFWTILAAGLWTPAIVLASAQTGQAIVQRSSPWWSGAALAAGLVFALRRTGIHLGVLARARTFGTGKPSRRVRVAARLARWRRWEFWPMWLFYAPVTMWTAWLAIRYRGLNVMTAANPGIADGGTVGESKFAILQKLPHEWTIPADLIAPGATQARLERAEALIGERDWAYPLIVKPDVGQRGAGVRQVRSQNELFEYLARVPGAVLLQPYHPGPYEAGIFYYRVPGQSRGQILSITDKRFPLITGDGTSTLAELIYQHPRYRLQVDVFLHRLAAQRDRVLARGERLQLAIAGNHAQGTTFLDGGHLSTPALERRIDAVAQTIEGFFIGRFDVRYSDVEAFQAGDDLAIVELNGATAESTNIYDPDTRLIDAYRQLFHQWSLVFRIGAENRRLGTTPTPIRRLLTLMAQHLAVELPAISD